MKPMPFVDGLCFLFALPIRDKELIPREKDMGIDALLLEFGIFRVVPDCMEVGKTIFVRNAGKVLPLFDFMILHRVLQYGSYPDLPNISPSGYAESLLIHERDDSTKVPGPTENSN